MWKRSAWFWMWSEWAAAWKWLRAGGACLRHSQCCYKRIWRPCAGPEIDYTGWPVVMTIDKPTTYDNDVCAQSMDRTNGRVLGQIGLCAHAVFILFFGKRCMINWRLRKAMNDDASDSQIEFKRYSTSNVFRLQLRNSKAKERDV